MSCTVETKVHLCDFHREQAWERWVSKTSNEVSHVKNEVLSRLRIALAETGDMLTKAIQDLKASDI